MKLYRWLMLTALVLIAGCGSAGPSMKSAMPASEAKPDDVKWPTDPLPDPSTLKLAAGGSKPAGGVAQAPAPVAEAIARKIIYSAEAQVVVQEFEKAEQQLVQAIREHKGYVAQAETGGKSGLPRTGRWRVRIPVERFDSFLEAVAGLGVPQKMSRDSKDVTEEFYDLEARLKTKKAEEAQLLVLVEKATGKLEDLLTVRRELTRVREEIEREEGRLRLLANLTSLTTVSIFLQEIKDYVPPQTPTFGNTVSTTFSDSWEALMRFGKGLAIAAVALAPWLPVMAVVAVPAWLAVRAHRRARPAVSGRTE